MARSQQSIQASILDRLIDDDPQTTREPVQKRQLTFEQAKAAVLRDVENLLNTKGQILPVPSGLKELNDSLFVYGLPDYTAHNPKSPSTRNLLRQDIERTITRFEPRLRNVSVRIDTSAREEKNIRLKISAILVVDPLTEPVAFDTYFDVNKGECKIQK